jgi:hypothetical protein
MSDRQDVKVRLVIDGKPVVVSLIHNPLIDDVLITEAKISAYGIEQKVDLSDRRVTMDIRDFLIRIGVER